MIKYMPSIACCMITFGRGGNDVMKRLKAIRRAAHEGWPV